MPLAFHKDQPTQLPVCWFPILLRDRTWTSPECLQTPLPINWTAFRRLALAVTPPGTIEAKIETAPPQNGRYLSENRSIVEWVLRRADGQSDDRRS